MPDKKQPLLVVAGPTASGKTALGIALAKEFGGEVISADSMQIYKGLDVATAKPTAEETEETEETESGEAAAEMIVSTTTTEELRRLLTRERE